MANEVVARYLDGRLVKGISLDVDPARPSCHVRTTDQGTVTVELAKLKALFFVKSLVGNSEHQELLAVDSGDTRARGACLIELRFADGERVVGMTVRYPPNRPYFFVVPADPKSNNLRVLVNRGAVVSMARLSDMGTTG